MEHLTTEQLKRYRKLQMEADELEQVEAHLSKCEDCRKRLLSVGATDRAVEKLRSQIFAVSPADCLTYDQLADFLDGKLDEFERERVESHLKVCPQCSEDLRVLEEFRSNLQERVFEPSLTVSLKQHPQRLRNFLSFRWLFAFGAVAIFFVIALFAIHNFLQGLNAHFQQMGEQISRLHEQLSRLESQVQTLQKEQFGILQQRLVMLRKELERLASRETTREAKQTLPLVALKDTVGTVTLTEDMRLQMPLALPSEWRERIVKFLAEGKVSQPEKVQVAMSRMKEQVVMRGGFEETKKLQLLSPVVTSVMPDQIVFRWKGVEGATYRVLIADESGSKILWESKPTIKTSLSLPIKVANLKFGEVYTWQVEAILKGETKVSPPARFWVLDEKSASIVRKMRKQFARSALALSVLYASYGLKDEAAAQIQKLQKLNPNHPMLRLLQEAIAK